PVTGELRSALLLGEKLNADPTWGGDSMDELIGGSSANDYTTVGIPSDWNIAKLYDRNAAWGINQLKPKLSEGYNFVGHLGHGNYTSTLGIAIGDVTETNFTNDGEGENFSLIYTQACYGGGFDYSDCIAEKFMSLNTAAVAMISNSRYGWYAPSSTNGSSHHFHREYMDAFFGENIAENGEALNDSKIDIIPFTLNSGVMHWVHYELNLLGDPAMKAWTDTPATFTAQLPTAWITGLDHYVFQTNAPRANIRIKDGADFLYEGFADVNGLVYIHLDRIISPGSYDLFVNAPNVFPWHTQITFQATASAYLSCLPVVFHVSDGLNHTGEEIPLTVTLRNVGQGAQIAAGTLVLSCSSPNVQIISGSYNFAPIAVGDSLVIGDIFRIGIQGTFPDLTQVQFILTASFDAMQTESHAWLTLNAPILQVRGYQAENPTLHFLPGDSPTFTISFANQGTGNTYYPVLDILCESPYAQLSSPQINLPIIAHTSVQTLAEVFSVTISPLTPLHEAIVIAYTLSSENGADYQGTFRIYVSDSGYHFENNLLGYTIVDLNPAFVNQWHRDEHRNHTDNGLVSMKFGGIGGTYYDSSSYGALVSPVMNLGLNSQLSFWHWMQAEKDSNPLQAWDGGMVQMSLNGGDWFQIAPIGAYPCSIVANPACPLPADTPVWSGSFDWTEAVFDLSAYSGSATFRWVFGSDGALCFEGWYVDEIALTFDPPAPMAPQFLTLTHVSTGMQLNWQAVSEDIEHNPITPSGYNIYRASEPKGDFVFLAFTADLYYLDAEPLAKAFYRVTATRSDR
ncbi:MAG: C25 family cysteine peptidase, partial [Candidatus Cloacimonetes bacterium]|nr:C25 family cysteine peptidase [Candidatus Cloacimonadota bacterium]